VDIRIGVADSPREVAVVVSDDTDREKILADVQAALAGEIATLHLIDDKGKDVIVSAARMAYVEVGAEGANPIGFG